MQSSVSPAYFEAMYQSAPDPWNYETSGYEQQKYQATVAALPRRCYESALEIGGSIGVLTEQLAPYSNRLLSIDASPTAQVRARRRCCRFPQVRFQVMQIPAQFPPERFDLIVLSEVGYYLCESDLYETRRQILSCLRPQGHLLLIHWLHRAEDFRLTGDQVHQHFLDLTNVFQPLFSSRNEHYRIDVLERFNYCQQIYYSALGSWTQ